MDEHRYAQQSQSLCPNGHPLPPNVEPSACAECRRERLERRIRRQQRQQRRADS